MSRRTEKSETAFKQASKVLVGGVNSPVRAFAAVGGTPPVIAKAIGSQITDIDDNTYVDYVCGYGPAILGHASEPVVTAINKAVRHGTTYGAPTEVETKLGVAITAAIESIEMVRFVSSGTEAVMSAVRLARGTTGRDKVIKCVGCYHGHSDSFLVAAGSGAATLGTPSSPGVPTGAAADTLLVDYNDLGGVEAILKANPQQVAAVLVEPVAGNMGVVLPEAGYLQGLRDLCDQHDTLLIFDEVITGFRVGYGGAQGLYGVKPDLTTLGKIIGGCMPVGAFGGRADIMQNLAPVGDVYQAGTLSGNPAAMAAGLATLAELRAEGFYDRLEAISGQIAVGMQAAAIEAGIGDKVCFNRVGAMMCCFFTPGPVTDFASASRSNTQAHAAYFHTMLDEGVYLAPSQFEAMLVSSAHTDADVDLTLNAAKLAFAAAAKVM
ncbi:MAG: glutamate-1-semialdehyde 2,1-aminomutase [Phycisphaerales bacterium]|jgi:glutamate-1-semialdehyde 2,1-aminomutase|nr:glutamate-1-semialdehyde 2,1-aminomutase [Phycisphaerales bacterium]